MSGGCTRAALSRQTADLLNAMDHGNLTTQHGAGDSVYRIYGTAGSWAGLFASFSPDEDFAETFKFQTLMTTNSPVTYLPIHITGRAAYTVDVFSDRKGVGSFQSARDTDYGCAGRRMPPGPIRPGKGALKRQNVPLTAPSK